MILAAVSVVAAAVLLILVVIRLLLTGVAELRARATLRWRAVLKGRTSLVVRQVALVLILEGRRSLVLLVG